MTNESPTSPPPPGIYHGVAHETYLGWDAASNSRLDEMRRSPAHCRAFVEEPPKATPALVLGSAIHCAVLEPDHFGERYALAPECDRRTKDGKKQWADFQLANLGKTLLDEEDWVVCEAVRRAAGGHPDVREILRAAPAREVSMTWDDRETGLRCKLRADIPCPELGILADVKSTPDASPREFSRSIFNYGYHRQGSLYLDGAAANEQLYEAFCVIAVEKAPPFGIVVYRLADEALSIGRRELRPLINRYAECKVSGLWPCYEHGVRGISLPDWVLKQEAYGS